MLPGVCCADVVACTLVFNANVVEVGLKHDELVVKDVTVVAAESKCTRISAWEKNLNVINSISNL